MSKEMNIVKRMRGKTPKFFVFLRRVGLSCTALGTGLMALKAQFNIEVIDDTISGQLITAGLVIAAVCSLAVEDTPAAPPTP